MRARALALLAVSLLLALMMGVASPAHAAPAPPSGPKIISAKLVKDGGVRGELDAGDKVRITFNRDVKISEPESWGLSLIGRNGSTMRLDPESAPYGFYYTLWGRTLTLDVNLIPAEYGVFPLTYPVTITYVWHIVGKDQGRPINLDRSPDRLIN